YDGVELAVRDASLVDAERLQEQLHQAGLAVAAIGTGQAWGEDGLSLSSEDAAVRSAAIERLGGHIELAARLEALVIVGLVRGKVPAGGSWEQTTEHLVASLGACAGAAAERGV